MKSYSNAVMDGNIAAISALDAQLEDLGVKETSLTEILQLTGESNSHLMLSSADNISFKTAYSEITVNGSTKEIMRVYAIPLPGSDMFHMDVAENREVVVNKAAKAINFAKVWGLQAAGNIEKYGPVISAFVALKDSLHSTPDTNIYSIDAAFRYQCVENTVFLYFKNSSNLWTHIGTSNYLTYVVNYFVDSYEIDGVIARPDQVTCKYSGDLSVNGYNDATAIYKRWSSVGPYTDLQFRTFDVGAAADVNHSVVSLDLVCPLLPGYCS